MRNTPINATIVGTSIPTQMLRSHVGHDKAAGQDGSIGQPQYSAVERICNRVLLLDHRGVNATDMRYSMLADVPFAAVRHYKLAGP